MDEMNEIAVGGACGAMGALIYRNPTGVVTVLQRAAFPEARRVNYDHFR